MTAHRNSSPIHYRYFITRYGYVASAVEQSSIARGIRTLNQSLRRATLIQFSFGDMIDAASDCMAVVRTRCQCRQSVDSPVDGSRTHTQAFEAPASIR